MVHATLDGLLTPRSGVSSEGESQPSNVGSQSVEQGVRGTWFHRIPMGAVWYFIANAGAVCFLPFLNLLYKAIGFSDTQIGYLNAFRPMTSALSSFLFTILADSWHLHRVILLVGFLTALTTRCLIAFVAQGFTFHLVLGVVMEAAISPVGVIVDAMVMATTASGTGKGSYGRTRLWASVAWGGVAPVAGAIVANFGLKASFCMFAIIYSLAFVPTILLPINVLTKRASLPVISLKATSSSCHEMNASTLSNEVKSVKLDVNKTSTTKSVFEEHQEEQTIKARNSSYHQPTAAESDVSVLITDATLPNPFIVKEIQGNLIAQSFTGRNRLSLGEHQESSLTHRKRETVQGSALMCQEVVHPPPLASVHALCAGPQTFWAVIMQPEVIAFFMLTFFMGYCNGSIGYLFLFLQELGSNGTIVGLSLTMNCIAEVPIFLHSQRIIQKIGILRCLEISTAAYCLRMVSYILLPTSKTVWVVLGAELLQGFTFALAWSTGMEYCRKISPQNLASSVMGVYTALYSGLGAAAGGLCGGLIYGRFGGRYVFVVALGAMAAGALCSAVVAYVGLKLRKSRNYR